MNTISLNPKITSKAQNIAEDIYWVGVSIKSRGLQCNPYLIIDGTESILIDPGSVLDFEYVYKSVTSLIPLKNIKYVILGHQDADICSSIPLFEEKGLTSEIVSHWRTTTLVKYYGIKSNFYNINENGYHLKLSSGRTIIFIHTPYLHFPGAIASYDTKSKTLFSSDLFGAYSYNWTLYADKDYIEKMKTFHEHYMPGNEIIRPVMEKFLSMDISQIASQHGSIIKENITDYIKVLRDLECGSFIRPIKKELIKSGGYANICNLVLKRYCSIFEPKEILQLFDNSEIKINNKTWTIEDYNSSGKELWNKIFDIIYAHFGVASITVIEPYVKTLIKEYDIFEPNILKTSSFKNELELETLSNENIKLKEQTNTLEEKIKSTYAILTKCPNTNLYNESFFKTYIRLKFGKPIYNVNISK